MKIFDMLKKLLLPLAFLLIPLANDYLNEKKMEQKAEQAVLKVMKQLAEATTETSDAE